MKIYIILLVLFFTSCSPKKQHNQVHIALTGDKKSVQFKGLDYAVMREISRDTAGNPWQDLVPVYRMPADTDMKTFQPVQPGKYKIVDSAVVFTPDTPFAKGQTYFVRWYRFGEGSSLVDYLKGRIQPGRTQFTDLIFKQ